MDGYSSVNTEHVNFSINFSIFLNQTRNKLILFQFERFSTNKFRLFFFQDANTVITFNQVGWFFEKKNCKTQKFAKT